MSAYCSSLTAHPRFVWFVVAPICGNLASCIVTPHYYQFVNHNVLRWIGRDCHHGINILNITNCTLHSHSFLFILFIRLSPNSILNFVKFFRILKKIFFPICSYHVECLFPSLSMTSSLLITNRFWPEGRGIMMI